MQAACPKCGLPADQGLCPQCTLESMEILDFPDLVEVTICSVCGSRQVKGNWQIPDSRSIEELASQAAVDSLWFHKEFETPKIELELGKVGATRYLARACVTGSFKGQPVQRRFEIPVRIKLVACDRCSRMAGNYFQSTVQVRGNSNRQLSEQEMEECKRTAESMADAGYRGGDQLSFIQEIKKVKGGLDIVLGSTRLGRHLAKALQESLGGRILESCKLVGRKDNRDVFRSTLLVRLPRLKRGDIVSFRGSLFEVTGFDGKTTQIASLREGRRSSLSEENAENVEILGNRADAQRATVISEDHDILEILDPETFRVALAPRPRDLEIKSGEEVAVVRTVNGFIVLE
ncbi:NMD3 family protein [uncultured archaeon]|nr:NMD3 family protein [uncultured archaeon]